MNVGGYVLAFLAGAAAGAGASYILFKDKIKKEADEEIKEMREYVKEKTKRIDDVKKQGDRIEKQQSRLERAITSYDRFSDFDEKSVVPRAEKEHPREEDNGIYEIDEEDWVGIDPHYDKFSLTFYEGDATLVDDADDLVDIGQTIGLDNYEKFDEGKMDTMYVRNDNMSCDYEVVRVLGSYKEQLGDI